MSNTLKKTFKIAATAVMVIVLAVASTTITHNKLCNNNGMSDYSYQIYRSRTELAMEGVKDNIVTEIDNYIDSVANDSGLNGIRLFELCDKYGVDVRFAMAQAEAESHFGTKGVAAKTNMVWNVKAYDNRTADDMIKKGDAKTHPDMSIEPYLILLTNEYLVNGKTEYDMFDKFVDSNGKRYASNPNYETMVLNIYNRINENTKLKDLLKEYRRYKMILS
jgi:flagellum-specific peptidoglycan hydrolase FlgJ